MKIKRQSKIIELIKSNDVETQEDLTELLAESGYFVTQATVSRDIRELKLTKVQSENGGQKYAVLPATDEKFGERFLRIFKDGVVSLDMAVNIVVIKTLEGMAMAVAACVDSLNERDMLGGEIIGCIAGDDNVFCVVRSEEQAVAVISTLRGILK